LRHFFGKIRAFSSMILSFDVLLLATFLLLIFSEQKNIRYCFLGVRSISITDISFIMAGCIFVVSCFKDGRAKELIKMALSFWYILLPLFSLVLLYLVLPLNSGNFEINSYLLAGCSIFLVISFLLLSKYPEDEIVMFVFRYGLISVFFFLLMLICLFTLRFPPFYYGDGTPALHFPFNSPGQAAVFGSVILMLSVGSILALGKNKLLYVVVPIMAVAIPQTGSRSVTWLLVNAWIVFLLLYFLYEKFILNKKPLQSIHLVLCTVLSIIFLSVFAYDTQFLRSVSLFNTPIRELVSGAPDARREEMWKTPFQARPICSKISVTATQGSLHNIYLDLLASGGVLSLALFSIFLFSLLMPLLMAIGRKKASKNYPFYLSIGLTFFIILGGLYSNPFLHLRFIWVFWGLVMAILYQKNPRTVNTE